MRKILAGVFIASNIFAATEIITTYKDIELTKPSSFFKDGATIYVAATVPGKTGGYCYGSATSLFPPVTPWPPQPGVPSQNNEIPLVFLDFDNDGTYTTQFSISSTQVPDKLWVQLGGARIRVDLDNQGDPGEQVIVADYSPPSIDIKVSDDIFSPYTSIGFEDMTTITLTCKETGTYKISIEGKKLKEGEIGANIPVDFCWDGYYWDEILGTWKKFSEGSHTVDVSIFDLAGNEGKGTKTIIIDSTPPSIELSAEPQFFSPGTSTPFNDYCYVSFSSNEPGWYDIKIDGTITTGVYSGNLSLDYKGSYTWDGSYTTGPAPEGPHIVQVTIWDNAGNFSTKYTIVTIDRQWPLILSLTENTGGEIFYRDEIIQFTLKARDFRGDKGTISADNGEGWVRFGTKIVPLFYCGDGYGGVEREGSIYQGYYTVREGDYGTFTPYGFLMDKAGNPAINTGFACSSIRIDGTRERLTEYSRIVRLGMIPEKEDRPPLSSPVILGSSTDFISLKWEDEYDDLKDGQWVEVIDSEKRHIWVGSVTNSKISLNNGLLYYGFPVSDYRDVKIGSSFALKRAVKAGDNIIFSLTAVSFKDKDRFLLNPQSPSGTSSFIIYHPDIKKDDYILISDNIRTWLGSATDNGSFTIKNENLYSGPIPSDYSKIDGNNLVARRVSFAKGGDAKVDIGAVRKNIQLSDDGVNGIGILSGDVISGDGVYSGVYTVREGDDTNDVLIYGDFIYNRKRAENAPYSDSRIKITIDSTPPEISNNIVSPVPFNPYLNNLSIGYHLSERSYVKIKIFDKDGNLIRILNSPDAQFGDNVWMLWDGKNSGGIIVPDGRYKYTIDASDEAGNKAVTRHGEIILTYIEIRIRSIDVAPNPFRPRPNLKDTADVMFDFEMELVSSDGNPIRDEQLNNLGFNFTKDYHMIDETTGRAYAWFPYSLLDFKIFDKEGNEIPFVKEFPDLNKYEEDPWPSGILHYDDLPPYWFYPSPELANPAYKDMPDGNPDNDYSILRGFDRINGNYRASFGLYVYDWDNIKPGKYILQATARLVAIEWEFTLDKTKGEEKFHAFPNYWSGYGLKSDYFEVAIEVLEPEPPELPDSLPPVVIASNPANGQVFKSGTITEVWARLKDKPDSGAVGIDFGKCEITLVDSTGRSLGGHFENDGIDKLLWMLDSPLGMSNPGSYTIEVKAVDKNGNCATYSISFIIQDIIPPDVSGPYPQGKVISPFEEDIYCFVSDVGRGDSGIDWEGTSISLKRQNVIIPIEKLYFKESGKLVARPGSLTTDGTYTVSVKAYDSFGNYTPFSWSFYLKTIVPIIYNPYPTGGILSPYKGTISVGISELEEGASGIDWDRSTIILKDPDNKNIPLIITWQYGTSNNIGTLIGNLTGSLTKNGVWTYVVHSYDFAGHSTIGTYTFELRDILRVRIKYFYASDYRISPGTSTGIKDTTDIIFSIMDEDGTYSLLVDNSTLTTGFLKKDVIYSYTFGSPTISPGSHTIELRVIDKNGSISTGSLSIYIDNTYPIVSNITDNTGGRTFYRNEIVFFVLETKDTDVSLATCILNDNILIPLTKISDTLWQGQYQVKEGDKGIWSFKGFLMDFAGNGATSTTFGTISVDGTRENPITSSRIIRFGMIPEEKMFLEGQIITGSSSDTLSLRWKGENLANGDRIKVTSGDYTWITKIENNSAVISNSRLYYGAPISDYRLVNPGNSYLLKSLLKKDDRLIASLEAVRVEDEFLVQGITKGIKSATITSPGISPGMLILVFDNSGHNWLSLANTNGQFTISNAVLYSGSLISDYNSISNITIAKVSMATGGNSSFDLGNLRKNIQLLDNGLLYDKNGGDGIYSGDYAVTGDDFGEDIPLIGHFYISGEKALNDPYQDEKISIDGVKPIIRNSSAIPSPFNPYTSKLNIRYNLSEEGSVIINIKNRTNDIIFTIKDPGAKFGDNIDSFWDGRDIFGEIVPDGLYYYTIDVEDLAGNIGDTINGEVRVTSLEMIPTKLVISPNPFSPDDTIENNVDFLVKFRIVLKSSKGGPVTDAQLNNLGFDFVQGWNYLNVPYGLLHFDMYDVNGNMIKHGKYPDMTAGNDIDPWLYGFPNYGNYKYSLGNPQKPDKGDGDTENDFGCLVPFLKDNEGNYYCDYEYGELDWKNPPGTYILRIWAELVSIYWELKSDPEAEEEKWHAEPLYHGHYGFQSGYLDGEIKALEPGTPTSPDKIAPIIDATSPALNEVKNPYSVSEIWVRLRDNEGGVGVSLLKSSIWLEDSNGQKVSGVLTNDGKDTLYWRLTNPLVSPGNYTIKVIAYDKNDNNANYSISFSVKDTIPPNVSDPYPSGSVTAPFQGPITVNISEIQRGESGIDWEKTAISLKRDGVNIPLATQTYVETGSNTGQLKGILAFPLTQSGTYTISVVAYDKADNGTLAIFYFNIPPEIRVGTDGDVYLDIPYGTDIILGKQNTIPVSTNTVFVELLPDTLDHPAYKLVGSITKFYYWNKGVKTHLYGCRFTKDVTLTLHYKDFQVPSGIREEDLAIYGSGSSWLRLGGTVDTATNKISYTISAYTPIKDMYAIMYLENDKPIIQHTKPSDTIVGKPIDIKAIVTDTGSGINYVNLYYYPVGSQTYVTIPMTLTGTNTFTCQIEGQVNKGILKYWIEAVDKNGNIGSSTTYQINISTREEVEIDKAVYTKPNPAKGFCQFRLYLQDNAEVEIGVYTITGELVWDYKGNLSAGVQFIDYNCKNKDGNKLGTGLYIYKVTIKYPTRKDTTIKKMVIIKQ